MKKIASVVILAVLTLFLFTACGQGVVSATREEKTDRSVPSSASEGTVIAFDDKEVSFASSASNAPALLPSTEALTYAFPGYIEFGSYPQTVAEKKAVKEMSQTTDQTGYYYSTYDKEHYAKVTIANVYGNKYDFINEKTITNRNTYYFKVEPIKWKVFGQLDVTGSSLVRIYMVSDLILDSSSYLADAEYYENPGDMIYYNRNVNARATDWLYSSLRKWLNGDFYRSAFSAEDKEKLNERVAGTTTDDEGNEVTETDKVFAMSYDQANALDSKFALVSDYARCRGTWMSIYPDYYGYGRWWTLSEGNASNRVCYGGTDTKTPLSSVGESLGATYMGVRPVISMDVEDITSLLVVEEEE